METSILQINTGGEALLCLFCCKHESTFMLEECWRPVCVCALSCGNVYGAPRLFIFTLERCGAVAQAWRINSIGVLRFCRFSRYAAVNAVAKCHSSVELQPRSGNPPNEEIRWLWLAKGLASPVKYTGFWRFPQRILVTASLTWKACGCTKVTDRNKCHKSRLARLRMWLKCFC